MENSIKIENLLKEAVEKKRKARSLVEKTGEMTKNSLEYYSSLLKAEQYFKESIKNYEQLIEYWSDLSTQKLIHPNLPAINYLRFSINIIRKEMRIISSLLEELKH